jgi:hypothetical protein
MQREGRWSMSEATHGSKERAVKISEDISAESEWVDE